MSEAPPTQHMAQPRLVPHEGKPNEHTAALHSVTIPRGTLQLPAPSKEAHQGWACQGQAQLDCVVVLSVRLAKYFLPAWCSYSCKLTVISIGTLSVRSVRSQLSVLHRATRVL